MATTAGHWTNNIPARLLDSKPHSAKFLAHGGWVVLKDDEQVLLSNMSPRDIVDEEMVSPIARYVSFEQREDGVMVPTNTDIEDYVALDHEDIFEIGTDRYVYYVTSELAGLDSATRQNYPTGMFVCISDPTANNDTFAYQLYSYVYLPSQEA